MSDLLTRGGTPSFSRNATDGRDTEIATQLARSASDYLGARHDIGREVAPGLRELFVACEPGLALQQQFDLLHLRFIALHDVGAQVSHQLLSSIAMATGHNVERLVIRRTGYGTVLAKVDYTDCPTPAGPVRLYCTDVDADSAARHSVAQALLNHATLSAVLVGEQPAHALDQLLNELSTTLSPQALSRDLLFLPLGAPHVLQPMAQQFANRSARIVRLGPQVATPAEAWLPLRAAWNGLLHPDKTGSPAPLLPDFSSIAAGTGLTRSSAEPDSSADKAAAAARQPGHGRSDQNTLDHFLRGLGAVPGVVSACVFDVASSRLQAHLGAQEAAQELARRGTLLLAAGSSSRRQLSLAGAAQEVVVAGPLHTTAVHLLAAQPEWAVHLIFTPSVTDWPALRTQLLRLDATLPRGPMV